MARKNLRVELLRYTWDPEEIIAMGAKLCYFSADISELKKGIKGADQTKFIQKLMEMGHFSPIEHASFTFGVEGVSRSLLAQITRHRLASFSVQSQRYVSELSSKNADGVFDYIVPPRIAELGEEYVKIFHQQMKQIQEWYDFWVEVLGNKGQESNEDARFVLPNAAETKFILTMNARELLHFFSLRCCNRAQWEIQALADEMLRLVRKVAPIIFAQGGPSCLSGYCREGEMSCGKMEEVREKYSKI
jgi:thymidylate synthase (FAD)